MRAPTPEEQDILRAPPRFGHIRQSVMGVLDGLALKGEEVDHIEFTPSCYSLAQQELDAETAFNGEFGLGKVSTYLGVEYRIISGLDCSVSVLTKSEIAKLNAKREADRKAREPSPQKVTEDVMDDLLTNLDEYYDLKELGHSTDKMAVVTVGRLVRIDGNEYYITLERL